MIYLSLYKISRTLFCVLLGCLYDLYICTPAIHIQNIPTCGLPKLHFKKIMSLLLLFWTRHCLGVRYRTPRLRGYGSGTGHRATPMRTVSGSRSLWNNYSARLGIRGCVSVPARICSNCYFTNKNSCWSLTLLRPPSLIICIYCHAIQTSISLYKRYKLFNGREWKKISRYRSNLSYFIPFIFLILIFSIRSWINVINVRGTYYRISELA